MRDQFCHNHQLLRATCICSKKCAMPEPIFADSISFQKKAMVNQGLTPAQICKKFKAEMDDAEIEYEMAPSNGREDEDVDEFMKWLDPDALDGTEGAAEELDDEAEEEDLMANIDAPADADDPSAADIDLTA